MQSGLVVHKTKITKGTCKMRKEIKKKRNEKRTDIKQSKIKRRGSLVTSLT